MRDSVINLRTNNFVKVNREPGCYKWWFREECVRDLLAPLNPHIDYNRLIHDGNGFVALYFGIAKDLNVRANWHICQKHSLSSVRSGFLSTLRQSLSALLGVDMTQSEQTLNDFMDEYCEWEWMVTASYADAKTIEQNELSTNYYPLNIQGNKVVDSKVIKALKALRKKHKI